MTSFHTPLISRLCLLLPHVLAACTTLVVELPDGSGTGGGPSDSGDEPGVPTTGLEPTTGDASTTMMTATTTVGSAGGSGSDGSAPEPVCGDGVIEGDEACDDGWANNQQPGNLCTSTCALAVCGDGLVQPDNGEQCDDGDLNVAEPGYQQCSTICLLSGGFCGDGVVQEDQGEECEPSLEPDELENCVGMCRLKPRIVFLTSESYTGAMGGLAGADKRCNEFAAASPELSGSFRAWLLADGQSLADRFPEFSEPASWSFTSTGAELLAKSFAELVEHGPASPILYTEAGDAAPEQRVWTGITGAGKAAGGDCGQWSSTEGAALVGHSGFLPDLGPDSLIWHSERHWTDHWGSKPFCAEPHPIYCIQVSD